MINLERTACAEGLELKMANKRKRTAVIEELVKSFPKERFGKKGKKASYYNDVDHSTLDISLDDSRKNFQDAAERYKYNEGYQ